MKTVFASLLIIALIFLGGKSRFPISGSNSESSEHLNLHCPDEPLFLNVVSAKYESSMTYKDSQRIEQDWYSKAVKNIHKDEYCITYSNELMAFQCPNRLSNIRFIFENDGFTAKTRSNEMPSNVENDKFNKPVKNDILSLPDWSVRLRVNGQKLNSENHKFEVNGNQAHIENENIRIEYANNEEGMRQNFILKKKISGNEKLRLEIIVETKLKMIVGADAVIFRDINKDQELMKYSSLKVWDANGKQLEAHFQKQSIPNSTRDRNGMQHESRHNSNFSIAVNDDGAVYPITIDPLSNSPNWAAESNQASAYFGTSVSTAGDVNGDGYSDVIVGALGYDNGQTNEGKAFVYYGSATGLSASANWTAESDQANAYFGSNVSTAGDVNGDGYSDVIVGAFWFDNGQSNEGRSYVYHGSSSGLSVFPSWTAESNQADANFGESVATAGDVNGDGYSDVLVGAYRYDNGQTDEGMVFLFHGSSAGLSLTANWTAEVNQANAYFGESVFTAGDVNGDGFSDVIVGSNGYDNGETDEGRVYVFHGSGSGLSLTYNWFAESNQVGASMGKSVSTAGDINGDGYSDVIVGSDFFDNGEVDEGRAFVFNGSASGLSVSADWFVEINQSNANFGASVSTAGDVNGDGYCDVIVGAFRYDNGQSDEGRAFVYNGSASGLSATETWSAESDQANCWFGKYVMLAGDVNGDGFSDVIIGADYYDNGETDEGKTYVYNGSPSGLSSIAIWGVESNQVNAFFGTSVSTAGDVNGDGFSDVIIGAYMYDNGQTNEGRAYVYHGSYSGLSTTANWTAESNSANAYFGSSVSTAGDVNGDGYSDVIIGAVGYINSTGAAYVFHGSAAGLSAIRNWDAAGSQQEYFGRCVSTAGDVNGDGYSDVLIGANAYDNGQSDEGRVILYHGSASGLSSTANWIGESNQINANYGISVSSAGDVNGDGFSDIIVGANSYDNGQTDEGRAFVYFGSASGLSLTPNWTAENDQVQAGFGICVSGAGDVNGDGFCDVIIGSWLYDNGQSNEGKAYLYEGSASGLSVIPDWSAEGNQDISYFGSRVSLAGDVNGDGYSDVVVGVKDYDNGQANEGKAFVYHGSPAGLNTIESWTAESNQADAYLGSSVSTAGDVNGDGYSDLIIGAENFDNGQTNEGKVFVYYGNGSAGLKSTIRQYKVSSNNIVYSGGLTGTNGQVRMNIYGKSPFGRTKGKIVNEYKANGNPFSGVTISNSTLSTGSGNITDLGTLGTQLNDDETGLLTNVEYKWRARVQYDLAGNPLQKFGPWKYYSNYIASPFGCFKALATPATTKQLTLTFLIQGFYDAGTNLLTPDTVRIYIRNYVSPNSIVDSAKAILGTNGVVNLVFTGTKIINNTRYYIQVSHRNSINTWNNSSVFNASAQNFDFTISSSQAYGNNQIQVDASPIRYAIYGGDVDKDESVDATDVSLVDNNAANFITGYVLTDLTGDNFVDATDFAIADNNASTFVSVIRP